MTALSPFDAGPAQSSPLAQDPADCRPALGDPQPGGIFSFADRQPYDTLPRDRLSAAIINCLRQAAGACVSVDDLIEWVWGDDPNGGPLHAISDIRVTVHRLRGEGFPIMTNWTRGYRYGWTRHEYCDDPEALQ